MKNRTAACVALAITSRVVVYCDHHRLGTQLRGRKANESPARVASSVRGRLCCRNYLVESQCEFSDRRCELLCRLRFARSTVPGDWIEILGMSSAVAAVNGVGSNGGASGPDEEEVRLMTEEELEKGKMRPPDIDQDMKEMERRKRVEAIMNSVAFREELEKIVESQLSEGYSGFQALQNISELIGIPGNRSGMIRPSQSMCPINDLRGLEGLTYAKGEKLLRCKLAALYRLIDMYGWSQNIYNHISVRVSQDQEHFLLNPFGLLYSEVTASTLVKVDMQGQVVDPGSTNFGVNVAGFTLHSALHASRPDLRCIIHIHTAPVVAVSAMKLGLLPLSQESLMFGDISYHTYQGILVDPEEKEQLARNLGPINKVMLLRNHGAVCCGESVEEAWYYVYHLVLACENQMKLVPVGLDNLIMVSDEARQLTYDTSRSGFGGVDSKSEGGAAGQGQKTRKFKTGEMEFEALMRSLDNAGMRTGYIYRNPLVKQVSAGVQSDVALPPTASNYGQLYDEDGLRSPLRRLLDGKRVNDRSRWLNSPNVYQKVEILETGSSDPKKITKWVADGSPTHSNAVKLEDNLQFVPKDTDPKEFKKIQKAIKENRRIGNLSAGPTSHLLEGVTWDEVRRMQDAAVSNAADHTVLVGAASKGIIQRDFQHNAVVYKTPYAKNPFDAISDQELDDYKLLVERKQRGEPIEEIEVEKLHISPERAEHGIVEDTRDGFDTTSPLSPLSDTDGSRGPVRRRSDGTQLVVHTQIAPSARVAQTVSINDDGVSVQSLTLSTRSVGGMKPPVPPKPKTLPPPSASVPTLNAQQQAGRDEPQRVQANVKLLPPPRPCVSCPPADEAGRVLGGTSTAESSLSASVTFDNSPTSPLSPRGGVGRATFPRSPQKSTPVTTPTSRSNSLSRGLQKMLKGNRNTPSASVNGSLALAGVGKTETRGAQAMHPSHVAVDSGDDLVVGRETSGLVRSASTHLSDGAAAAAASKATDKYIRRTWSMPRKPTRETAANGEDTEAHHSALSHSSKEGSPTKDTSYTDDSMSTDKKKKKKKVAAAVVSPLRCLWLVISRVN
ncbi:Class II aldolase/adducin N-terminal [Trinorchestia longiramus]|nr:Class II aldolase/adducin N-terminal [Trinorchestia longiramus]